MAIRIVTFALTLPLLLALGACSKGGDSKKPRYGKLERVSIEHTVANFSILLPETKGIIKHKGRIQINLGGVGAADDIREGLNIRRSPWPTNEKEARRHAILFGETVRNKRDGDMWIVENKKKRKDSSSQSLVVFHKLPGKTGKEAALLCSGSYTDLSKGTHKFEPAAVAAFEKMCRSIKLE